MVTLTLKYTSRALPSSRWLDFWSWSRGHRLLAIETIQALYLPMLEGSRLETYLYAVRESVSASDCDQRTLPDMVRGHRHRNRSSRII